MRIPTGGRLLDKVTYCLRKPSTVKNILDEEITVRDTFPYNPDSKTAPETARRWAEQYSWYDNRDGKEKYVPELITRDNTPFSITITDLHVRSEGGRAYKVIDEESRQFDLREDQIMEVLRNHGIHPGGKVPATFVWGILGSQMRLVLVGGELHKAMTSAANDKKSFEAMQAAGLTPTEGSLQPGHIYRKKDKSLHLFLGRVKRPDVKGEKPQFAFLPLPEPPQKLDFSEEEEARRYDNHDEKYRIWLRKIREANQKWETWSWRERCHYVWYSHYGADAYQDVHWGVDSIVFMASPKFEADLGEIDVDFFEEVRSNKEAKHKYRAAVNNWRANLHMLWKYGPNYSPYYSYPQIDWRMSREEQDKVRKKVDDERRADEKKTLEEYRDALAWL